MPRIIRSFVHDVRATMIGDEISLPHEESHHLSKVLRLEPEASMEVLNGMGDRFQVQCLEVNSKSIRIRIDSIERCPLVLPLIRVAVSLIKGKKWDDLIRPLTELGAHRITPLITDRTEVRYDPLKFKSKMLKWNRNAIEACKQSGNPWLPKLDEPISFSNFLSENQKKERRFLASLSSSVSCFTGEDQASDHLALLIGPEGGWSGKEEALAEKMGVEGFSLGSNVLRVETAAVSALTVAKASFLP